MKQITGMRVVVEIAGARFTRDPALRAEIYKADAGQVVEQIKRHVDDVGGTYGHHVYIESDFGCSHCGYAWETDPSSGEPVCCEAAQEEWKAAKP